MVQVSTRDIKMTRQNMTRSHFKINRMTYCSRIQSLVQNMKTLGAYYGTCITKEFLQTLVKSTFYIHQNLTVENSNVYVLSLLENLLTQLI